jgi:hypothetical protein
MNRGRVGSVHRDRDVLESPSPVVTEADVAGFAADPDAVRRMDVHRGGVVGVGQLDRRRVGHAAIVGVAQRRLETRAAEVVGQHPPVVRVEELHHGHRLVHVQIVGRPMRAAVSGPVHRLRRPGDPDTVPVDGHGGKRVPLRKRVLPAPGSGRRRQARPRDRAGYDPRSGSDRERGEEQRRTCGDGDDSTDQRDLSCSHGRPP